MIQEGQKTAYVGGGWGGDGFGGILGIILVIALLGGGLGGFGGGFGRGHHDGGGHGEAVNLGFLREGQFALQKDILGVGYGNEKNTLAIIQSQNEGFGKILNKMSENELREAYAKIAELNTCLSEQRVTGTILANLQPPRPIPAYLRPDPYAPFPQPQHHGFGTF